ncbi:hypothetical protein IG631_03041 [Alternaria alternata]|nr:hypothetical protein IG631_03041 [Alternaria alternata]
MGVPSHDGTFSAETSRLDLSQLDHHGCLFADSLRSVPSQAARDKSSHLPRFCATPQLRQSSVRDTSATLRNGITPLRSR